MIRFKEIIDISTENIALRINFKVCFKAMFKKVVKC
jgi:hypothetical protein